jgi:hypothetical protein
MNRKVSPRAHRTTLLAALAAAGLAASAHGQAFVFATNGPDGRLAAASRPDTGGVLEIEAADDFVLARATTMNSATFTGLLPAGVPLSAVDQVVVEIYRVFPFDSDTTRAIHVPTRTNSPSDVAFTTRDSGDGSLAYQVSLVNAAFTAANSVVNGINPSPNQTTGGEGVETGQEVQISVQFLDPLGLPADHYFIVPQVHVIDGQFLWLSAPKPIVAPGTPFSPDLQAWIRNGDLDPDWLRIGTDIVGGSPAPTFNLAFTLSGTLDCYVNCDGSTAAPFLNVNDFLCFQTKFAAGDSYANCDNSTTAPVLNVNDFLCFQYRFAAGCTAP